jgi:hypothetical protein
MYTSFLHSSQPFVGRKKFEPYCSIKYLVHRMSFLLTAMGKIRTSTIITVRLWAMAYTVRAGRSNVGPIL